MSIFEKLLSTKIEETPPVPLPPIGTYVLQVTDEPKINDRATFTVVTFPLQGTAVLAESVDEADLAKFGGPKNVRVRKEFLLPKEDAPDFDETRFIEAQNQLKRFIRDHLKIGEDEAASFKEAFTQCRGRYVAAEVTHRQDKNDSSVFYAQVGKTMPAE